MKSIGWTIAGLDTSGGSGITNDVQTFANFNVHCCSILSCIVSQNNHFVGSVYCPPIREMSKQINSLKNAFPPAAIKIGIIKKKKIIIEIAKQLADIHAITLLDPIFATSSGYKVVDEEELNALKKYLFPRVNVLTPNILEAEKILNCSIVNEEQVELAAKKILETGIAQVIIKGGHLNSENAADFWTNGREACWLSYPYQSQKKVRGTGCAFSSALAASLARGDAVLDAFTKAKAYVFDGINQSVAVDEDHALLPHQPASIRLLPSFKSKRINHLSPFSFPSCEHIGFYPLVSSIELLEKLIGLGVRTIQLRIKNCSLFDVERTVAQATALAKKNNIQLFINDYWQLAIKYDSYGVHLGQEDVAHANLNRIAQAKLRLGISCHSYYELTVAHALQPSYIACGPVFATDSKPTLRPLTYEQLCHWRQLSTLPVVAIGGICLANVKKILAAKVAGIAVISALATADLQHDVREWLRLTAHLVTKN
jgi:hydroxymethylpyrimidine kinase / phosphomethylpyrimidine kinase / thiamine-phosphate diphosphorylase